MEKSVSTLGRGRGGVAISRVSTLLAIEEEVWPSAKLFSTRTLECRGGGGVAISRVSTLLAIEEEVWPSAELVSTLGRGEGDVAIWQQEVQQPG